MSVKVNPKCQCSFLANVSTLNCEYICEGFGTDRLFCICNGFEGGDGKFPVCKGKMQNNHPFFRNKTIKYKRKRNNSELTKCHQDVSNSKKPSFNCVESQKHSNYIVCDETSNSTVFMEHKNTIPSIGANREEDYTHDE